MEENEFLKNLNIIDQELLEYYYTDKEDFYMSLLEYKLNYNTISYDKNLSFNVKYLLNRSEQKVIKTIQKIQKRKDKAKILKHIEDNKND